MLELKDRLHHKKNILWDWNGTLLDDVDAVVDVIGHLLVGHGLQPVSREQYLAVFCFPIREYYRRLGFDFEKEPFEGLSDRFVELYARKARECRVHAGAEALFEQLQGHGIRQSVLSAAHESHLREMLSHHGLLRFFDHVFGLSDHHAASKVERGKELIAMAGYEPADTILVGDTDHDLEVGRALGIEVLLLADGHQSYERLKAVHDNVLPSRRR
jgi:phosphoglycolate phosphatase